MSTSKSRSSESEKSFERFEIFFLELQEKECQQSIQQNTRHLVSLINSLATTENLGQSCVTSSPGRLVMALSINFQQFFFLTEGKESSTSRRKRILFMACFRRNKTFFFRLMKKTTKFRPITTTQRLGAANVTQGMSNRDTVSATSIKPREWQGTRVDQRAKIKLNLFIF